MTIPQVPFLVYICLAAIMSGVLNGRRHFWVPAFAPVILNLSLIATVGMGIDEECWALPYAVLAGGIANVALHLWALRASGGLPPCVLQPLDAAERERLRDLRRAFVPTLIASGAYQINAWLDSVIAMIFVPGNGAVAILYFGARLLQFPMALIGHGVTTAAYPELASRAAQGWSAAGDGIREAVRLLAYWLLPAAAGLLATAEPAVRTIYQVGSFDAAAVARTVLVVQFLAIALIPMTLGKLLMRSFHAHREQGPPLRIALWMVGCNLALNLALVQTPLREAGIALSSAITGFGSCAAYLVALHRRGVGQVIDWRGLVRPALAALAMAAAVAALLHAWPQPQGHGSGYAALRLGAAVALGAGIYLALAGRAWMRRQKTA
jgi:putative peptidoglycan lipid II flippase